MQISDAKLHDFYSRFMGQTRPVLLEHSRTQGVMHGFTDNYIRVEIHSDAAVDNTIVQVRLGDWNQDKTALLGEMV